MTSVHADYIYYIYCMIELLYTIHCLFKNRGKSIFLYMCDEKYFWAGENKPQQTKFNYWLLAEVNADLHFKILGLLTD